MIIKRVFLIGFLSVFRRTLFIPRFRGFYKNVGRLWRLSDCEELVGVNHRRLKLLNSTEYQG